jgi:hypothetical protein
MEEPKKRKVRDVRTGEFAFDNNFDRMCVCGHTLGVHVHGGWDCGLNPTDHPETEGCTCQKFRPSRAKKYQATGV